MPDNIVEFVKQSTDLAAKIGAVFATERPPVGLALQAIHKVHCEMMAQVMGELAGRRLHEAIKQIVQEDARRS